MLFSLVLAVASKEVELWQTFDDFAPRRLMDEGEEMEAMEDPEMDGDEEEPLEGDEMTGDLAEEEEEGLNPLMIAVPAVAVAAAGALYFMNKDKKENQEDKPFTERLTMEGLQKDSEVQVAAAAATAVTGLGLWALLGGGGATPPASAGFLASPLGTGLAGMTVLTGTGLAAAKGLGKWPFNTGKTPMEKYTEKLTQLQETQKTANQEWEAAKAAGFFKESEKKAHEEKVRQLKEEITAAGDQADEAKKNELKELEAKMTEADYNKKKDAKDQADRAVTEHEKTKPEEKKKQ